VLGLRFKTLAGPILSPTVISLNDPATLAFDLQLTRVQLATIVLQHALGADAPHPGEMNVTHYYYDDDHDDTNDNNETLATDTFLDRVEYTNVIVTAKVKKVPLELLTVSLAITNRVR
jgi:hypothetical protein